MTPDHKRFAPILIVVAALAAALVLALVSMSAGAQRPAQHSSAGIVAPLKDASTDATHIAGKAKEFGYDASRSADEAKAAVDAAVNGDTSAARQHLQNLRDAWNNTGGN